MHSVDLTKFLAIFDVCAFQPTEYYEVEVYTPHEEHHETSYSYPAAEVHTQIVTETHYKPVPEFQPHYETGMTEIFGPQPHGEVYTPHHQVEVHAQIQAETHYEPISEFQPHFETGFTEIITPQPQDGVYTSPHQAEVHPQIESETKYKPISEIQPHFESGLNENISPKPHEVHTPRHVDLPVLFFGGSRRVVTPQDLNNQRKLADRDEFEIIAAANVIEGNP